MFNLNLGEALVLKIKECKIYCNCDDVCVSFVCMRVCVPAFRLAC